MFQISVKDMVEKSLNQESENTKSLPDEKKMTAKQMETFTDPLQSSEPKKVTVESVNDNSDPLQSYDAASEKTQLGETLTVAQLPFSNKFKKYLDDTILCISPYILLPVPYLETDVGRKCDLRRFFYKDMYYSEQFETSTKNKWKNIETENVIENNKKNVRIKWFWYI